MTIVVVIALFGPFFAPHSPVAPVGAPLNGPSSQALLGTDFIGRDVLSRVLWGGRSVLGLALAATVLAYGFGVLIGLVAGYKRWLTDPILMRSVDILLAVPPLLFLLVLVTAVGTSVTALVIGVALIQMPGIARLVRTVTIQCPKLRRGGRRAR